MGKVVFDISVSVDGFITGANQRPEEPMGDEGERLHRWAFGKNEADRDVLARANSATGAIIAGWRTYEHSLPWWGGNGPSGEARVPVFVPTRDPQARPAEESVYRFVAGGLTDALDQARQAAGDGNVVVMGGAETGRRYLRAGVVDEILLHVVPVLFGSGTHLFTALADEHIPLEVAEVVDSPAATHIRYRVVTGTRS